MGPSVQVRCEDPVAVETLLLSKLSFFSARYTHSPDAWLAQLAEGPRPCGSGSSDLNTTCEFCSIVKQH